MNFIRIDGDLINLDNVTMIMPLKDGETRFFFITEENDFFDVKMDFDSVCDRINVREA